MKNTITSSRVISLLIAFATAAAALAPVIAPANAKEPATRTQRPIRTTQAAPESGPSGILRTGAGFSTFANVAGSGTALSMWLDFHQQLSVQGIFAIGSSSPFTFSIGSFVRKTLFGTMQSGFHLGGGTHLGTMSGAGASTTTIAGITVPTVTTGAKFYIDLIPLFGFHFLLPGSENIGFSLDGGANIMIHDGNFGFALQSTSAALGLAVHYFF